MNTLIISLLLIFLGVVLIWSCIDDIEIIDKKIGKDGIPYVKYKYSDGSLGYSNFYDFPFKTE